MIGEKKSEVTQIPWAKKGKGLTASMFEKNEGLLVKYSIKQKKHGWETSVSVHDAAEPTEFKEFRKNRFFEFGGGTKALDKAKSAAQSHWGKMVSGEYGESPDLEG